MTPVLSWRDFGVVGFGMVYCKSRDGRMFIVKGGRPFALLVSAVEDQCKTTHAKPKPADAGVRATLSFTCNAVAWQVFDRRRA